MNIDNETPISHFCYHGTTFSADRADLRNGVEYAAPRYVSPEEIMQDFFSFGAWHAFTIHPELNGFQGYDSIKFSRSE